MSIVNQLVELKESFAKQNNYNLVFETECLFAKQQIMKNDLTLKTAENNQDSLRNAILNVAAIGISLNPASAHAYLVPRGGMVCLDLSFKGLVKLATDAGAIEWAKAELAYEGDVVTWKSMTEIPGHEFKAFDPNRFDAANPLKNLIGGYCVAKLTSGGYLVDRMTAGEILEVRNSSKARGGPWAGKWAGEMAKKTLIKRAYKSWPQSGGLARIEEAINILNQHEGLESLDTGEVEYLQHSKEQANTFHELLKGDPVDYVLWWRELDDMIKISLYNSFPKGDKTKGKQLCKAIEDKGWATYRDMLDALTEACEGEDTTGAAEILEEANEAQRAALIESLDIGLVRFANSVMDGI